MLASMAAGIKIHIFTDTTFLSPSCTRPIKHKGTYIRRYYLSRPKLYKAYQGIKVHIFTESLSKPKFYKANQHDQGINVNIFTDTTFLTPKLYKANQCINVHIFTESTFLSPSSIRPIKASMYIHLQSTFQSPFL